jgi:hypothetical protein
MNSSSSGLLVYLLIACLAALAIIRFIKSRKKDGAALVMEVVYLCIYAFMGGIFLCFILEKLPAGDWLWAILFLVLYWGGFLIRSFPLFKQLSGLKSSKNE